MYYKLDEEKNVIHSSFEEWANFIENKFPTNYWIVAKDNIDDYKISTIFIGLCHNHNPISGIPIVFETAIFDKSDHVIFMERYSTWKDAEEGHQKAINWFKNESKYY